MTSVDKKVEKYLLDLVTIEKSLGQLSIFLDYFDPFAFQGRHGKMQDRFYQFMNIGRFGSIAFLLEKDSKLSVISQARLL